MNRICRDQRCDHPGSSIFPVGKRQEYGLARRRGDAESTTGMSENDIGAQVIRAAINVHREIGPGLLETVYEVILARELSDLGLKVDRQIPVPIVYKGIRFDEGFRADMIVEKKVLLELKSVERILPVHKKQVQTYLRLTCLKLGYLLNFGEAVLKSGITRCVNGLEEEDRPLSGRDAAEF